MGNILNIAKYQIRESKIALIFFYGIITGLAILMLATSGGNPTTVTEVNGVRVNVGYTTGYSNLSGASIIFLFIVGLNSFKSSYKFMQANNVSRRNFYIGNIISMVSIALFMALIDSTINVIMPKFVPYVGTMSQIYNQIDFMVDMVWSFALLVFAFSLGWLITLIYYRSNNLMKLLVSISPVIAIVILTYLGRITNGKVINAIVGFLDNAIGISSANPLMGMFSFIVGSVLIYGISYLLLRKAPVKI